MLPQLVVVRVAQVAKEYAAGQAAFLRQRLSQQEFRTFGALRPARRLHWLAGREAAWRLLNTGVQDHATRQVQVEIDELGRPSLVGHGPISLAHAGGFAVCLSAGPDPRRPRAGVDIEPIQALAPTLVAQIGTLAEWRCTAELTVQLELPANRADLVLWTLKESLVKAAGGGFRCGWDTARLAGIPTRTEAGELLLPVTLAGEGRCTAVTTVREHHSHLITTVTLPQRADHA